MERQLQTFENKSGAELTVYVEMYPDRYVLKPGDTMDISYDHEGTGCGLHTIVHDGALQIYMDHFDTAVVTINGEVAESWVE